METMEKQCGLNSFSKEKDIKNTERPKERLLSASSINTYLQCPRKFYYQYVAKLPTKDSIHLLRGSIVHSALEDFYDFDEVICKQDLDDIDMIESEFVVLLHKRFNELWNENKERLMNLGLDDKTLGFFFDESLLMLSNWAKLTFNKIKKIMSDNNIGFYDAFNQIKPIREQYYKSNALNVHGYIDAIHKCKNEIIILDYKTSKSSELKETYKLQLGLYALMYKEKHNRFPDKVGLFFLKNDEILIKPNEELIVRTLEKLNYVKNNTKSNDVNNYPMNPTKLCKWSNGWSSGQCDFYEYCFGGKKLE